VRAAGGAGYSPVGSHSRTVDAHSAFGPAVRGSTGNLWELTRRGTGSSRGRDVRPGEGDVVQMVAVPEMPVSEPVVVAATGRFALPRSGRAVAVAVHAAELLRPGSDLVRLAGGFPEAEILVATDGHRGADPDDDDLDQPGEELRAEIARLGLPDLRLHRLGLPDPLPADADEDLVAALSELIGFDPEPGVYCLAPAPDPADPARTTVNRVAERIAQVYGIPLLRYRCPELAVLGAQ
jgi:hypothetical protein